MRESQDLGLKEDPGGIIYPNSLFTAEASSQKQMMACGITERVCGRMWQSLAGSQAASFLSAVSPIVPDWSPWGGEGWPCLKTIPTPARSWVRAEKWGPLSCRGWGLPFSPRRGAHWDAGVEMAQATLFYWVPGLFSSDYLYWPSPQACKDTESSAFRGSASLERWPSALGSLEGRETGKIFKISRWFFPQILTYNAITVDLYFNMGLTGHYVF